MAERVSRASDRVPALESIALSTFMSAASCRNSGWASVRPKRYLRAPFKISARRGPVGAQHRVMVAAEPARSLPA